MHLKDALLEEVERLMMFKLWYTKMNAVNPDQYPLDIPDDNAGVWFEMMQDFNPDEPAHIEILERS